MNTKTQLLVALAMLWDVAWKVAAVWTALRRKDYKWIAPLILVNSVGLLPIVYLRVFSPPANDHHEAV